MSLKLGDYVVFPVTGIKDRYRYDSQIGAEIRARSKDLERGRYQEGSYVLKVVSVVTKDKVESE